MFLQEVLETLFTMMLKDTTYWETDTVKGL